jgi:amino acid adenylation domain-containing protein/non-ribosomal peptide synthase protein (TIGR01720 family)
MISMSDSKAAPLGKCSVVPANILQPQKRFDAQHSLHSLVERHAAQNFAAIAITYGACSMTYGELNASANRIARRLVEYGIRPNDLVAIATGRCIDMIVGLLAILKSGAGYLPIDPGYPEDRIRFMIEDGAPKALLTLSALKERTSRWLQGIKGISTFEIDTDWSDDLESESESLQSIHGWHPGCLAYVIYTSGSTGRPKAVQIEHQQVTRLFLSMDCIVQTNERDAWSQFHSICFDFSVWEIWGALSSGGRLVLVSEDEARDSVAFYHRLVKERVTILSQTPSAFTALMAAREQSNEDHALRAVIFGGESLKLATLQGWIARNPMSRTSLINLYGITETTVFCTARTLRDDDINHPAGSIIGRPLPDMSIYILDENGKAVAANVQGEIYVGGDGVGRGYLNRPELNNDRFLADPFSVDPEARMYRSGDVARYLDNGDIEYIGRNDFQVKLRGFRIELGEIESTLLAEGSVHDVVVDVRETSSGDGRRLFAYVVPKPAISSTLDLLERKEATSHARMEFVQNLSVHAKKSLLDHMQPSAYVLLAAFPLTQSGKVDKGVLASLEAEIAPGQAADTEQESDVEHALKLIWQDVLGLKQVGVRDNFYALGGDSILAIMVASRAKLRGLQVGVRDIFKYQTIRELAPHASVFATLADQNSSSGLLSLLPIQRRYFEHDASQLDHFVQSRTLIPPEGFSLKFLREAVRALFQRHDALRLRFRHDEGQWVGEFVPFRAAMIGQTIGQEFLDQSSPECRYESLVDAGERIKSSISISEGPIFTATFFTAEEPSERRLLLAFHHLVVDGVSWRIVLDDLELAFEQWQNGEVISLGAKSGSLQDWGRYLEAQLKNGALDRERDYWREVLMRPVERLPLLSSETQHHVEADARRLSFQLGRERTSQLLGQSNQAFDTQINDLLLAALLVAVNRWANLSTIRVWMEGHGREADALEGGAGDHGIDLTSVVGWFTTYFPVVLTATNTDGAIPAIIDSVKQTCSNIPSKGCGYGVLRYLATPPLTSEPEESIAEIVFNYLGQFHESKSPTGAFAVTDEDSGWDAAKERRREHVLGLNGSVTNHQLEFRLDYHPGQTPDSEALRLCKLFEEAIGDVVDVCLEALPNSFTANSLSAAGLEQDDRSHLRHSYPGTKYLYPATPMQLGMIFHSLIDGQRSAYTNQISLELDDSFDEASFRKAWEFLIDRHDILRTAIVGLDRERPLQLVVNELATEWTVLDYRHLSKDEREHAIEAYYQEDKERAFDFADPGLFRFAIFRLDGRTSQFLWTYHHVLLDGWSMSMLWQEFIDIYKAFSCGKALTLPDAVPYRDYAEWLSKQDADEARQYWRARLTNIRAPCMLPFEQSTGLPSAQRDAYAVRLSREASNAIAKAAQTFRVSGFTLFQAAWALLCHSYTGEKQVTFGVILSGRAIDLSGVDRMIGLLIGTVPAVVEIETSISVEEWLRSVQAHHIKGEAHAQIGLGEIQSSAPISGSRALFDSLLIYQNFATGDTSEVEAEAFTSRAYKEQTHYGITVVAHPGEQLHVSIEFDPGRFSRLDVVAMTERLARLLEAFASVASTDTANHLLKIATFTSAQTYPMTKSKKESSVLRQGDLRLGRYLVHQLFENHAEKTPDRSALVFRGKNYSYDELNSIANRLANSLLDRSKSIGPDSLVAIMMPRSDNFVAAILGVWKAGAAYIPIDPALPSSRIRLILSNAKVATVVCDRECALRHEIDALGLNHCSYEELVAGENGHNPDIHVSGNDLSYVLFTSGSTGAPKGVMVEHIGVLNNILNKVHDFQITETSRIAQTASQGFDISVWQMFIALTQGGTTIMYDDNSILDVDRLIVSLKNDRISLLEVVPSYLVLMLERVKEALPSGSTIPLTDLVLTGETADANHVRQWFELFPNTRVFNAYGPTEASDDVTHHLINATDLIENPLPVGRTLANFDIHVVDEHLNPVSWGQKGEIVVTGVGVARGYLNLAGATEQVFVESPFEDKYKKRLYRTGDIGHLRDDGVLMFHGRKDRQVKIHGFRIELDEIELNISKLSLVRQAVVLDITEPGREAFLCAFLLCNGEATLENIVTELKLHIPSYMIPSEFRILDRMPTLSNGKADRNQLRATYRPQAVSRDYEPPRGDVETRLASLWQEILKVDSVGANDDFFELGGDSFKAIRIAARFGVGLEVPDVYNLRTIRNIANKIGEGSLQGEQMVVHVAGSPAMARTAILGFANSAGDPISFHALGSRLTELSGDIVTYAIKFPRNPVSNDDEMLVEISRLASEICDTIGNSIQQPLVIFGQCNGSALAIAVARELHRRGAPAQSLCLGGALMRKNITLVDDRSDIDIEEFLTAIGATTPTDHDDLAFFLNDFRYDSRLANAYYNNLIAQIRLGFIRPIDTPVHCFAGTEDTLVEGYQNRYQDWASISSKVDLIEVKDCGHFLLRDGVEVLAHALLKIVAADIFEAAP